MVNIYHGDPWSLRDTPSDGQTLGTFPSFEVLIPVVRVLVPSRHEAHVGKPKKGSPGSSRETWNHAGNDGRWEHDFNSSLFGGIQLADVNRQENPKIDVASQVLLVGGLEHFLFSHIVGIIIPIDFHIFQRGGPTTNQSNDEYMGI